MAIRCAYSVPQKMHDCAGAVRVPQSISDQLRRRGVDVRTASGLSGIVSRIAAALDHA